MTGETKRCNFLVTYGRDTARLWCEVCGQGETVYGPPNRPAAAEDVERARVTHRCGPDGSPWDSSEVPDRGAAGPGRGGTQ